MKRAAEKKTLTKTLTKVPIKKDGKALSSDSLTESSSRLSIKKDTSSKSCGITRPESPLLKIKKVESGLSIDSLADSKKKPLIKKTNRMDTSISTDSLMTDITSITTPRSMITNKSSPVLGKVAPNLSLNHRQSYEKLKKSSPPTQQRNALSTVRRPGRSLENSTAASRSRTAAVVNTYQGSLNLRKSLLDAAKAPDIPSKALSNATMIRTSLRQSMHSMKSSYIGASNKSEKYDKKDETVTNNQRSSSSPATKRSPKSNVSSKLSKSTVMPSSKQKPNKFQDKLSNKVKSQTTGAADKEGPKFLNQSSRSGTFLKDEPTILNKSDIQTAAIDL
jgi:BTB/POZ domain-containing protein 8